METADPPGPGPAPDLLRSPHAGTRGPPAGARHGVGRVPQLPGTDLPVTDLCPGGGVFGRTADEPTTHAVLDRFADAVPGPQRPSVDTAGTDGDGRSGRATGC